MLFGFLLIHFKLLWPEWQMQSHILRKRHICLFADAVKLLHCHSENCLANCYYCLLQEVVFLESSDYCSAFCPSLGKLDLTLTLEAGD